MEITLPVTYPNAINYVYETHSGNICIAAHRPSGYELIYLLKIDHAAIHKDILVASIHPDTLSLIFTQYIRTYIDSEMKVIGRLAD